MGFIPSSIEIYIFIVGSTEPWLETLLVASSAVKVVTFEYNHRTYEHPKIDTVQYASMRELPRKEQTFDALFSISSFDHDGLGRFNDPVCANADITAMNIARDMLRPSGLLFLSVPVGADLIVWNSYRRYGKLRFPRLLLGWEEVGGLKVDTTHDACFVHRSSVMDGRMTR